MSLPIGMPPPNQRESAFSGWLDLFRALAAFAVLYGHARVLFMSSMAPGQRESVLTRALYFLSGYGHTAVIIFFVLSGFLVGGTVIRAVREERWSWRRYGLQRATRLYIVLIPALFLTLSWDYAEQDRSAGLTPNDDTAVAIVQTPTIQEHTSFATFLGNCAFLQEIAVPSLGSNTPLWSLANEFWYYVLFPLLWLAVMARGWRWFSRLGAIAVAAVIMVLVGPSISLYFLIWLLGGAVWLCPEMTMLKRAWPRRLVTTVAAAGLLATLVLFRARLSIGEFGADALVGVLFALLLYCLKHNHGVALNRKGRRVSGWFADFSYTLYLTHLPALVFLRACLTYENSWAPVASSWIMLLLILLAVIAYAFVISLLTERQTDRLRKWIENWGHRRSAINPCSVALGQSVMNVGGEFKADCIPEHAVTGTNSIRSQAS
jgi:peptidoglycan/LPS O-acetylase OafA/YrhL